MKKLILLFLQLIFMSINLNAQSRIVNGDIIDITEVPWQIAIKEVNQIGEFYHVCGGSIINNEWIITAGHCINSSNTYWIHAGVTDQTDISAGQLILVDQVIVHPTHSTSGLGVDMALLHLSEPLCFNESVQPIEYATPQNTTLTDVSPETPALLTGWGFTEEQVTSDLLRGITIPIIDLADAFYLYHGGENDNSCRYFGLQPSDERIAFFGDNGKAPDSGDSGGPAVIFINDEPILVGAFSFGGCPRELFPSFYSNIREYSDFITNNITTSTSDCCEPGLDMYITTPNTIFEVPQFIPGDLYVQSGATLTIKTVISFGELNKIVVEDGGKLILEGGILKNCPSKNQWSGIRVLSGGELDIKDQSKLINANIAVSSNANSTISIKDSEFISGFIGLDINGSANVTQFKNVKASNYTFGIYGANSPLTYSFEEFHAVKCEYALFLYKVSAILAGSTIEGASTGVRFNESHGSAIIGTEIYGEGAAVSAVNSLGLFITKNRIGSESESGEVAINMINCNGSLIRENEEINATRFGIRTFNTWLNIIDNQINVQFGLGNTSGGGIQVNDCNGCQILDNYVDAEHCSFGIEVSGGVNNEIANNEVKVFSTISTRTAAIRSMGSHRGSISNNEVSGLSNTTGIIAQNSSGNEFRCNEVLKGGTEGLGIYYNSVAQDIKGNKFYNSSIDLAIRSRIGLQVHRGNEFINGVTRAVDLSSPDIAGSRFFVNETIPFHLPSDPEPDNDQWFQRQNHIFSYYDCGVSSGPRETIYDDEESLCDYYIHLLSLKDSLPEKFFINTYHLLKYQHGTNGYDLPDCIALDSTLLALCGLDVLAGVTNVLTDRLKLGGLQVESIRYLYEGYIDAPDEVSRAEARDSLVERMVMARPFFEANIQADTAVWSSLIASLDMINCSDELVRYWKDVLLMYIQYLQDSEISNPNKTNLISFSMMCSDMYGDVIHTARALSNTYDGSYFDIYDDCPPPANLLLHTNEEIQSLRMTVLPNPTTGEVTLRLNELAKGRAWITDINGRPIQSLSLNDSSEEVTFNLNTGSGVYIIHVLTDKGTHMTSRLLVVE